MTARARLGSVVDAAAEATVVPGFSRIGVAVRSRLLPEFTAARPTSAAGRTVLITGATSGIGYAAAVALARQGAAVHFLARDEGRAAVALRGITKTSGSTQVSYGLADLEDLGSVRCFAREYGAGHRRLDILIHNAGTIHPEFRTDGTGTELTYAGQVVAPFLLTAMLLPRLSASGARRVITVSSGGMYTQRLDTMALPPPEAGYRGAAAYARVKRAQVALSGEWARRTAGAGVAFHAMHPGWADTPGLAAALPRFRRMMRPTAAHPRTGRRHHHLARHGGPRAARQRRFLARPPAPGPSTCCRGPARRPARPGSYGTGVPVRRRSPSTSGLYLRRHGGRRAQVRPRPFAPAGGG